MLAPLRSPRPSSEGSPVTPSRPEVIFTPRSRKTPADPGGERRQLPPSRPLPRELPAATAQHRGRGAGPPSTGTGHRDRTPKLATGAFHRGVAPQLCIGPCSGALHRSRTPWPCTGSLPRYRAPELRSEAVHRDRTQKPSTGALHRGRAPSTGPHCGASRCRSSRAGFRIPSFRRGRAGSGGTKIPGNELKSQPRHRERHPPPQPAPGPSREQVSRGLRWVAAAARPVPSPRRPFSPGARASPEPFTVSSPDGTGPGPGRAGRASRADSKPAQIFPKSRGAVGRRYPRPHRGGTPGAPSLQLRCCPGARRLPRGSDPRDPRGRGVRVTGSPAPDPARSRRVAMSPGGGDGK